MKKFIFPFTFTLFLLLKACSQSTTTVTASGGQGEPQRPQINRNHPPNLLSRARRQPVKGGDFMRQYFIFPFTFILLLLLFGCAPTIKETADTKNFSDYAVTETITYDQNGKIHSVKRSYVPKPSFSSKVVENIIKSMLPLTDEVTGVTK